MILPHCSDSPAMTYNHSITYCDVVKQGKKVFCAYSQQARFSKGLVAKFVFFLFLWLKKYQIEDENHYFSRQI
jgi:hypothetical protein